MTGQGGERWLIKEVYQNFEPLTKFRWGVLRCVDSWTDKPTDTVNY